MASDDAGELLRSGWEALAAADWGWQVTGVDIVPKALRRAGERAREARVEMRLIEGDVTKLRATGVGSGYPFLLDFGLFHPELGDEKRAQIGREVSAVAASGATLLMAAWAPGRRGPLPRGASRADIETAYPAWDVIDEEGVDVSGAPFYRHMRKRTRGSTASGGAERADQATRPSAGSIGSPASTQAFSPPAMLYAS
jgi:hypothetical protein